MVLENLIESINKYIISKGCKEHLVLHRSIVPAKLAKVYKIYKYTVWLINKGTKYRVFNTEYTEKTPTEKDIEIAGSMDKRFLDELVSFLFNSTIIEDITYGRYINTINE